MRCRRLGYRRTRMERVPCRGSSPSSVSFRVPVATEDASLLPTVTVQPSGPAASYVAFKSNQRLWRARPSVKGRRDRGRCRQSADIGVHKTGIRNSDCCDDPIRSCWICAQHCHPEGNLTGIALDAGIEMQGKQLDILRQAVPSIARVAYLSNRDDWEGAWGHAILAAGRASGISIIGIPLEPSAEEPEYRQAFETTTQQSAEALIFNGLPPNLNNRDLIAKLALEYRFPAIGWDVGLVEKG